MEFFDSIIEQYREVENTVAMMLMEIHKKITEMEKLKMNETEMKKETSGLHNEIYVPFAAYEMQEERHHESLEAQEARNMEERQKLMDRHDAELDKVRKHYQRIVLAVSVALTTMIVGIFAFAFYFLSNYTFATVSQDGDGLNNYINQSSEVQVDYGAEDYRDKLSEFDQETEGSLDK